jgi:large subunit ribosomal protein L25
MLGQVLHEVEIECLPDDIPSHIDIDVSNLELNGAIHISDLPHSTTSSSSAKRMLSLLT